MYGLPADFDGRIFLGTTLGHVCFLLIKLLFTLTKRSVSG